MPNKLITRAELARRCNISKPSVTGVCATWPSEAFEGKKIVLDHPTVREYLTKHAGGKTEEPEEVVEGIDPLWEHALAYCYDTGDWSVAGVKRKLCVGHSRAKKIVETFKASELLPGMKRHRPPNTVNRTPAQPKRKQPNPESVPLVGDRPELTAVEAEIPQDLREFQDWTLNALLTHFGTHTSFKEWLKSLKEIEAIEEKRLKNAQTRGDLVSHDLIERVLDIFDTQHLRLLKDGAKSVTAEVISKHQSGGTVEEIEVYASKRLGTFITAAKERVKRLTVKGRGY